MKKKKKKSWCGQKERYFISQKTTPAPWFPRVISTHLDTQSIDANVRKGKKGLEKKLAHTLGVTLLFSSVSQLALSG